MEKSGSKTIKSKLLLFIILSIILILIFNPFTLFFGTLYVLHGFNKDFLKIDDCLDRGGRWDYDNCECKR